VNYMVCEKVKSNEGKSLKCVFCSTYSSCVYNLCKILLYYRKIQNIMVEWLVLFFCMSEIPGSCLGPEANYPLSDFLWFSPVPW
jgi:hypothetical protein